MSKTIEALRRFPSKDDILHDQIANTYFRQKPRKRKAKAPEKHIKVNVLFTSLFAGLFIAAASAPPLYQHHLATLKAKINNSNEVRIIDNGRASNSAIRRFAFRGNAKSKSLFSKNYLILHNTKKYNWADASLDFRFPIDLSAKEISVSLKGTIGGERAVLVLRDANNRSCRLKEIYLTPAWKTSTISLRGSKNEVDLTRITHMRLEPDYVGESSKDFDSLIDSTIYIKDLVIIKEGRKI